MGRPSKLVKVNLDQVETLGQLGLTQEEVAMVLGVADSTLRKWKKKPDFGAALKKGATKANAKVLGSLYRRAVGDALCPHCFKPIPGFGADSTAIIFWLKNRMPERYRDRHDQVISGSGDAGELVIKVIQVGKGKGNGNGNGNGKGNGNGGAK